jgi:hypothetical protein
MQEEIGSSQAASASSRIIEIGIKIKILERTESTANPGEHYFLSHCLNQ